LSFGKDKKNGAMLLRLSCNREITLNEILLSE